MTPWGKIVKKKNIKMRRIKFFNTLTLRYINKYKNFKTSSRKVKKDGLNKTYDFFRLIRNTLERKFVIKVNRKKKLIINFQFLRCLKLNDFKLGWNHKVAKYRAKLEKKKQEKMKKQREKAARKKKKFVYNRNQKKEPSKKKRKVPRKKNIYLKRSKKLLKGRDFSDLKKLMRSADIKNEVESSIS